MVSVTSKFFQSNPNGISPGSVKQDVLGFLSLVVSYAKRARSTSPPIYSGTSPKSEISIMPRTEFVSLYAQVSGGLPGSDTLYNLVKVLACYKNDGDDVEIDSQFCDGNVDAPKPNKYMDGIGWCLKDSSKGDQNCLLVSDWIASIQSGPSPDKLTTLDKLIDGQIGDLGTRLENVVGTTRGVPIFEFRDLDGVIASKFQTITSNVESELQKLHQKYQSPPSKRRKVRRMMRNGKRQSPSPCPTITPGPAMPTCSLRNEDPDQGINAQGCICGSTTLPLLTVPSATHQDQSCSYTAFPTSSVPDPISIMSTTYTSNCQACTKTGGIADSPTCTTLTGCTPTSATPPVTATTTLAPPPVCKAGFYGTDQNCGGVCNGPKSNCQCIEAGFLVLNNACTCTC